MKKKSLFISYSLVDKKKVSKIKKDIESIGYQVWIYPEAIEPSDNIIKSERQGISDCDFMLLMHSANASQSDAVYKEIEMAQQVEKDTGKKKLIIVNIDPQLPLKNEDAIQICDLSNRYIYAREFHKLMSKIEVHRNYKIAQAVTRDLSSPEWFKVSLSLGGANLDFVREVDYQLHPDIATDSSTKDHSRQPSKNFSITFYTDENEVVFAIVRLKDGSTEELRHFLTL